METGLVVNAVVTMYSTLTSRRRLIGSITSRQLAIIGISFEILRSRETEKSESM